MSKLTTTALFSSSLFLAGLFIAGCTYDGDAMGKATSRPTDRALADPYGRWSNVNTDVSGGGTSNLNRDAFKRDWDSIWLK